MQPNSNIPLGFCQCGCGQKTTLITASHPGRGLIKGQYRRFVHGHFARANRVGRPPKPLADRFWAKVDKSGDCWIWRGSTNNRGYGAIEYSYTNGKQVMQAAHRVAWILTNGPIPEGMMVCHRCDNPPCVRPDHLFLGSGFDNMADMAVKGRSLKGIRNHKARLTPEDIETIRDERARGVPLRELAERYGVALTTISAVARGENWKHI